MAAEGGSNHVESKTYMPLDDDYDYIDKVLEDDDLEEDIENIFDEIDIDEYICQHCSKKMKSKGGLKLHITRKHVDSDETQSVQFITTENISKLLKSAETKLIVDDMYPTNILTVISEAINDFCGDKDALEILCTDINSKVKFRNGSLVYTSYYEHIVKNCTNYFQPLIASIIIRMFGDQLSKFKTTTKLTDQIITKNIKDNELAALQYLGGFVMQKLFRKYRNSSKYKTQDYQEAISLLQAGKADSNTNSRLCNALSRGGLWFLTNDMDRIFIIAEKYFCIKTADAKKSRSIKVFLIVKDLMEYHQVQKIFKLVVDAADLKVTKKVAKNTLYAILTLYLRVRAYSFAKDIVEKHKIKVDVKGKAKKALRKNLKEQ